MDYDQLREILVNTENLYRLWQSTGLTEEEFIRANGSLIEESEKNRLSKELAKARQTQYLERQKQEGRRHLTALVSSKTYDRLCRLRDQSFQHGEKKNLGQVLDELLSEQDAAELQAALKESTKKTITEKPGTPGAGRIHREKPFDKDEICKIVVDLRDNENMAYEAIAAKLREMGYSPKTKGKDSFHHSTIAMYYRNAKKKTKKT